MIFWRAHTLIIILFLVTCMQAMAQDKKAVQFSGFTYAKDTDVAVPFVTVRNTSFNNETIAANHEGYFSFVVRMGDVIEFSSIGYETVRVTVPQLSEDKYTLRVELNPLVEELPVITLGRPLPWASIEEFNREFLAINISNDDVITAKRNLSPQSMALLAQILPRDAGEIQAYNSMQRHINMSNKAINQNFNNPLLNPFAWGALINQIKRGDYSRQRLKY